MNYKTFTTSELKVTFTYLKGPLSRAFKLPNLKSMYKISNELSKFKKMKAKNEIFDILWYYILKFPINNNIKTTIQ